ncbi:MAG: DUF3800 domain-containing protein, partial [Nanoarchaeota archaeon]
MNDELGTALTVIPKPENLYIFIDESGNLDFSANGTKFFILTCITTTSPLTDREKFLALKYELLGDGFEQEYFHATEDKQTVRDAFFDIAKQLNDFEVHSVIAQKNKVNFTLYEELTVRPSNSGGLIFSKKQVEEKLCKQLGETLVKWVFRKYKEFKSVNIGKVIIVF